MKKLDALSGPLAIAFGVLALAGGLAPGPPPLIDAGAAAISDFYARHGDAQRFGDLLEALAIVCFLLFLPGLGRRLAELLEDATGVFAVIVAAGAVAAACALIGTAAFEVQAVAAPRFQDPNVVSAIEVFARTARNSSFVPQAVLVAILGLALLGDRGLARAVGWAGLAAAALIGAGALIEFVPTGAAHVLALAGFFALGVWYILLGVTLSRSSGRRPAAPSAARSSEV